MPQVTTTLVLPFTPPLDWPGMLAFYRGHEMTGIESVGDDRYERVFRLGDVSGLLTVTRDATTSALNVRIVSDRKPPVSAIEARVRRMFALDADPVAVGERFAGHRVLGTFWKTYPGLRPSSGWDAFESGVATILGQLVSVKRAKELVRQLVTVYGDTLAHPVTGETARLFPTPEALAAAELDTIGTTRIRKRTLREFARLVASGELDLAAPDIVKTKAALLAITGIGPWSSEYIALRALAHHDSFPGADLILKRAVDRHPGLDLESLSPWRSYAAVLFWRHYASASLEAPASPVAPKAKRKPAGASDRRSGGSGKRGLKSGS